MSKKKILVFIGSRAEIGILKEPIIVMQKKYDVYLAINSKLKKDNFFYKENIKINKNKLFFLNLELRKTSHNSLFTYLSKFVFNSKKVFNKFNFYFAVVLGDRYEALLFAYMCSLKKIPLVHFHGGEATYGAIDENYRHAISKLSSLHFVSAKKHGEKLINMGENPKSVFNIGSMSYFAIKNYEFHNITHLKKNYNFLNKKFILITFHPETYSNYSMTKQIKPLFNSIKHFPEFNYVFTGSNLDEGGKELTTYIKKFVINNSNCYFYDNLGHKNYLNLMKYCEWVMGNSSSGIIETALMKKKSINIGNRQKGRITSKFTLTVNNNIKDIVIGIKKIKLLKIKDNDQIYLNKNGLKIFSKVISKTNFSNILPKFFYEKK